MKKINNTCVIYLLAITTVRQERQTDTFYRITAAVHCWELILEHNEH